jgi:hypothetical protein
MKRGGRSAAQVQTTITCNLKIIAKVPGTARQKAITLYERVIALAPVSLEAALARRELPRLKLNLDTVQRRYFCVYD